MMQTQVKWAVPLIYTVLFLSTMDHFTSWFKGPWSLFSPFQVDPPTPSYRGTGARRQTSTKHSSKPFDPTASVLIDRGLTNRPGENNCFLNAAVQVSLHDRYK